MLLTVLIVELFNKLIENPYQNNVSSGAWVMIGVVGQQVEAAVS